MKTCSKCVLPERPPYITLDEQGVCNVCRSHEERQASKPTRPFLETDLLKLLKKHKSKGEYDCLVMCSGGKDSTSSLYYMVKRYKLNPLAFTFNHGFETDDALENVQRAATSLGVDLMMFNSTQMHDIFGRIVSTGSKAVLCHLCSMWYMDLTYKMAARFQIPLIVAGWTKGQVSDDLSGNNAPEFQEMGKATLSFIDDLRKDPKYKDFPRSMEEVTKKARKKFKTTVISPHWFLPYEEDEYVELIKKELGWVPARNSYPHNSTNCQLNFLSVHYSLKNFGFTHYHVEMSKQIRAGVLSRDRALERLKINFADQELVKICNTLGVEPNL